MYLDCTFKNNNKIIIVEWISYNGDAKVSYSFTLKMLQVSLNNFADILDSY